MMLSWFIRQSAQKDCRHGICTQVVVIESFMICVKRITILRWSFDSSVSLSTDILSDRACSLVYTSSSLMLSWRNLEVLGWLL